MIRSPRRKGASPSAHDTSLAHDPLAAALASAEPSEAEHAKAQLVARGAAAVPLLLKYLDADGDGLRLRALSLLSLLGDARASGPVASLLRHPDPTVRTRAAGALARIASPNPTPALARLLAREKDGGVRLATARSLVRLVQTGHDGALRPLLELIANPDEEPRVRMAAMEALPWATTDGDGFGALLERLAKDHESTVAGKARRMLRAPLRPRLELWAIERLLGDLRSDRLSTWRRSVSRLGRAGSVVVEPVVEAMLREPADRVFAERSVLVLKTLSARQLTRLGPYLDHCNDPVPLEALVEVASSVGSRALFARIAGLVRRIAERDDAGQGAPFDTVRERAHHALARHGSRLAVDDLRRLLEDRRFAVRAPLAEAAALIGTRRELPALVRAYRRSRGVTRLALREAVLTVCRREKIRRTDRCLAALEPAERTAAIEILGAPRRKAPRRRFTRLRVTSPLLS